MEARIPRAGLARLALAGVLATVAAGVCAAPAAAEPGLRKAISMDSINHGGDPEDLTAQGNLATVGETGARWVRIWIRWDKAQPLPPALMPWSWLDSPANDLPQCGTGCGFRYVQAIDAQIAAARAAGLNVVLATWHFPRWANGTAGKPLDWAREDRGTAASAPEALKPLEHRIPIGQLGPSGHYGGWLDWLIGRYAPHGRSLALEIMNEPNHQLWPQQAPSETGDLFAPGRPVIATHIAEMMNTARTVSAAHGHPILVAGPALSDRSGADDRLMTSLETAVPATLAGLAPAGWTDNFVWSHHNYADIEHDISAPTRAELTRSRLFGRWSGRGGPSDPKVWLTEGGARLGQAEATDLERQAELVRRNWERMSAAAGIEMWTNYLLTANPVADSGLRGDRLAGALPRPVWETFVGFPAHQ